MRQKRSVYVNKPRLPEEVFTMMDTTIKTMTIFLKVTKSSMTVTF